MNNSSSARLIAFYLPQFHPIPENDEWWGKGFTEWTNVAKAKPLFEGHYQPQLPSDLGFYDLRVPEVREAQAALARAHGIEGFCYWHYWFGKERRLLERVFNEVLETGKPDFPFCLGWANQTWSGIWHGLKDKVLIEQLYPGEEDYRAHFQFLLKAFRDPRYIRVDGKPLFMIYRPEELPDSKEVLKFWTKLAVENGLPGLYFAGVAGNHIAVENLGYDSRIPCEPATFQDLIRPRHSPVDPFMKRASRKIKRTLGVYKEPIREPMPAVYSYQERAKIFIAQPKCAANILPCVFPNWDNTPRSGERGYLYPDATPALYKEVLRKAIADVSDRPKDHRIVFIKSWNEWAEGNYLEPSKRFGHEYLKATLECVANHHA